MAGEAGDVWFAPLTLADASGSVPNSAPEHNK
jgi:hypothetical protein